MTEPERKLRVATGDPPADPGSTLICPMTGLTIPECSCRRCATEQIRRHAPWVLGQRPREQRRGRAA